MTSATALLGGLALANLAMSFSPSFPLRPASLIAGAFGVVASAACGRWRRG